MIINRKRYPGLQAYKVKGKHEYLYAFHDCTWVSNNGAMIEVYAGLCFGDRLPNCHSVASIAYLYEDCREMSFAKLPQDVQEHLTDYIKD